MLEHGASQQSVKLDIYRDVYGPGTYLFCRDSAFRLVLNSIQRTSWNL